MCLFSSAVSLTDLPVQCFRCDGGRKVRLGDHERHPVLKCLGSMNWHLNAQSVPSTFVYISIMYCSTCLRTYFDMLQVAAEAHVINVKQYVEDLGVCAEDEKTVLMFHLNEARLVIIVNDN